MRFKERQRYCESGGTICTANQVSPLKGPIFTLKIRKSGDGEDGESTLRLFWEG